MDDPKALKLFQEVILKTKAGRIKWEPTANETEFFAVLPGGVTVSIVKWVEKDSWRKDDDFIAMVLRSDDRELLRVTPANDGVEWAGLAELYEYARRQALRVDSTVDKLLGELAKL